MPPVSSLTLNPVLLRAQAPDLVLRQGQVLAARVVERHGRMGIISLAGTPLTAELPEDLPEGARLRLAVAEATPERIVLRITQQPQPAAPPAVHLPLPDGRSAAVRVEEREAGAGEGDDRHAVSLTYQSPALGAIDFHLSLAQGGINAWVRAPAGGAFELADGRAAVLREAISNATGRPASVSITARRDPLDTYA